jgi:hypothetical protein
LAPGKNLPDSGVTSEPVGCYATPAQLGGSSGICRTTRPVTCYEEAHSPYECSLLTLINRRAPRLVRGTHPHFRARPRPRRRNLEPGALAKCETRNSECRVQSARRRLSSCGRPPRPAFPSRRPQHEYPPALRDHYSANQAPPADPLATGGHCWAPYLFLLRPEEAVEQAVGRRLLGGGRIGCTRRVVVQETADTL